MTSTDALPATVLPAADAPTGQLSSSAWLLHGLASTRGTLHLDGGRLRFTGRDGRRHVDLAADGHLRVAFPRRLLGTGMLISAPGVHFRISLTHPEGLTPDTAPPGGRQAAASWRRRFRALAAGTPLSPGSR